MILNDEKQLKKEFSFDVIADINKNQEYLYEKIGPSVINTLMEGYNNTVFAYG